MNKLDKVVFRFVFELMITLVKVIVTFGFRMYLGLFKIFIGSTGDRLGLIILITIYYIRKGAEIDSIPLRFCINLILILYIYGKSFRKMKNEKVEKVVPPHIPNDKGNNDKDNDDFPGGHVAKKRLKKKKKVLKPKNNLVPDFAQAVKDTIARIKRKRTEEKQKQKDDVIEVSYTKEVIN